MIYNITLKPVTSFFWGSEQVSELGNKRSYYLKSATYPQQTTILGMIRYQALAQHGLLSFSESDKGNAKELIGESSFRPDNCQGYGAIQQISPVQLQKGNYIFLLRDREFFSVKGEDDYPLRKAWLELKPFKENEFVQSVNEKNKFTQLIYRKEVINKDFIPLSWIEKNEFLGLLVEENHFPNDKDFLSDSVLSQFTFSLENIIQETERVGIEKVWEGKTKLNAYYKQAFRELLETEIINNITIPQIKRKILDSNWKFTFKMRWDEDSRFKFDTTERYITMGGEQSVFLLSANLEDNRNEQNAPSIIPELKEGEIYKLLLISDTFINNEKEFYQLPLFVNGVTSRFRNFIANVNITRQYSIKGERMGGFGQSTPSYLVKRGSVLYFENYNSLHEAIKLIDKEISFSTIGYNHYKIETEKYLQL